MNIEKANAEATERMMEARLVWWSITALSRSRRASQAWGV